MIAAAVLALLQAPAPQPAPAPAPPPKPGLLVIAPASYRAALEPYLAARAATLSVEFAALEDLCKPSADEAPPSDPPERIKRALHARWKAGTLSYALLVGDADTFPVRFMVLDRCTEAAFDTAFYASDLYYADLARPDGSFDDWNGAREGHHGRYFGEVRGERHKDGPINHDRVSYAPEIAVGRWPVHTAEEAARVAAKTLAHVRPPSPGALIVHAGGWIDARESARRMAAGLAERGFEVECQLFGDEGGGTSPARTLEGLGRSQLALHLGHGTDQGWHECLGPAERERLCAGEAKVYLSIGCSTAHLVHEPPYQAYLDESGVPHAGTNAGEVFAGPPPPPHWLQPGAFDSTGFGAELVRAPEGGALAYIGCVTGAQPCALTLMDAFQAALRTPAAPRIGDAWRAALCAYVERERLHELAPDEGWYPPSIFFQGMKFVLLGDPTLEL